MPAFHSSGGPWLCGFFIQVLQAAHTGDACDKWQVSSSGLSGQLRTCGCWSGLEFQGWPLQNLQPANRLRQVIKWPVQWEVLHLLGTGAAVAQPGQHKVIVDVQQDGHVQFGAATGSAAFQTGAASSVDQIHSRGSIGLNYQEHHTE
jgi:hypothetical protein